MAAVLAYEGAALVAEYDAGGALQGRCVHGPGVDVAGSITPNIGDSITAVGDTACQLHRTRPFLRPYEMLVCTTCAGRYMPKTGGRNMVRSDSLNGPTCH